MKKSPPSPAGLGIITNQSTPPEAGIEQMNEPTNESHPTPSQIQPAQTNPNKPAPAGMCQVCGRECRIRTTLCEGCEITLKGWIRDYPVWIRALREFLDSTAHYGGRQSWRVNLPAAPTPIRLSVIDHLREIEDATTALWRRLYAPPAMPWATSIVHPPIVDMLKACWSCRRLNRLPDIGLIYDDWRRLARRTLSVIDVPPAKHGIGRCLNPLCGVKLTAEVGAACVACPVCGNVYRVVDVRLGFLRECIESGRAFTAGECAELLRECGFQCNANTIRSWRRRGRIQPAGRNEKGRPLYRLSDVHRQVSRRDSI